MMQLLTQFINSLYTNTFFTIMEIGINCNKSQFCVMISL